MTESSVEPGRRWLSWRLSTRGRIALFGFLFLLLTACLAGPSTQTLPQPNRWVAVQPGGTGFACQMPRAPEVEVEEGVAFDGTPIRTVSATGGVANAAYGAVIIESRGGFIPNLRGHLNPAGPSSDDDEMTQRSHRSFEEDGFSVEEFVLESSKNDAVFHIRHYQGRQRVYSAFFAFSPGDEQAMQPALKHFFESVQLDPKDASTPVGDGVLNYRGWTHVYPRNAYFAVRIPGKPRFDTGRARLGDDEYETQTFRVGTPAKGEFLVRVVTIGERPEPGVLDRVAKILERDGYRLQSEEPTTTQGYAGRRGLFRSRSGAVIEAHYYVTNARIYVVQATLPAPPTAAHRQSMDYFFDSFRIL